MIKVTLADGSVREIEENSSVRDAAKSISRSLAKEAVAAKVKEKGRECQNGHEEYHPKQLRVEDGIRAPVEARAQCSRVIKREQPTAGRRLRRIGGFVDGVHMK